MGRGVNINKNRQNYVLALILTGAHKNGHARYVTMHAVTSTAVGVGKIS